MSPLASFNLIYIGMERRQLCPVGRSVFKSVTGTKKKNNFQVGFRHPFQAECSTIFSPLLCSFDVQRPALIVGNSHIKVSFLAFLPHVIKLDYCGADE